ncbi:MAG: winged helix-turn-helix domain-containing protein [Rudaea sp.]|uniref:winged helix-turn-helix domain-containing protein n=1 Tax=unclassified Rudaea TaxID=2627037 RepID=UPI0010F93DA6|nr:MULTISPECIES: winged helix-turn-helix domain-containing protein [unclassified Rudaea]MBN8886947.1 winged helix-turn-helix domain-containing protein [Rudaea sp.]
MNESAKFPLRIGAWRVDPLAGEMSRASGEIVRVEARTMRLLLHLAGRAGEVVSIDELLDRVWAGVIVTPDSVYQAITSLRRQLGDDPKRPAYIATVPRLGYRMIAAVGPWSDDDEPVPAAAPPLPEAAPSTDAPHAAQPPVRARRVVPLVAAAFALILVLAAVGLLLSRPPAGGIGAASAAHPASPSIGVLPFLDLTEGMVQEEFADGMTEELIGKLSKIPGARVPAPTASFHLKGKQLAVAEVGRQLGVVYVLDGSVRKSGSTLRVAARLMRADDGYVLWSETYDRPAADLLMIQDDIAGEVQKALAKALR